jgi:hypothetical protein
MHNASTLEGQAKSSKAAKEQITEDEGFKQVHMCKQHNAKEETQTSKKLAVQAKTSAALNIPPPRRLSPEISLPPPPQNNRNGH